MITVQDANDLNAVAHACIQRFGHAADGGVQARAVAAGGQDANSFFQCGSLFSYLSPAGQMQVGQRMPRGTVCACMVSRCCNTIRVFPKKASVKTKKEQNFACLRAVEWGARLF